MTVSNRAYSLLEIKSIDEEKRILTGIASTPTADLVDDIVEPKGSVFELPIPFLWQHDSRSPVGHVTKAKVTSAGIEVEVQLQKTDAPGLVKDRLDAAWQDIKLKLVRGLSIGFKALETARIEGSYGTRFTKWLWLELSGVTIAANGDCSIQTIKSIDESLRAAPGHEQVVESTPGASGKGDRAFRPVSLKSLPERSPAMNIAERIKDHEAKRAALQASIEAIEAKADAEGRTKDAEEQETFDEAFETIQKLDKGLDDLRKIERMQAVSAKPVNGTNPQNGSESRGADTDRVIVKSEKLPPGILFTRLTRAKMASAISMKDGSYLPAIDIARRDYGHDSQVVAILQKGPVLAGTTVSGNWAADLIGTESGAVAEFLEFLRPQTVIGKFAALGKPLKRIPFYVPYVTQLTGGEGYWTGEAKPKGLTSLTFDRNTLTPLKCANIAVASKESLQFSNPSLDMILRDSLSAAIIRAVDKAFVDPTNNGDPGVKPASVTYGTVAMTSTGDDEDDVDLDIRALFQRFINAENQAAMSVWGMSPTNAVALSMMKNQLGQKAYPDVTINGGFLAGLPVIVSSAFGTNVVLFAADQILIGGEDNVTVDMSDQASLEMLDSGFTQDQPTGHSLVSLWQNNLVGLRAEIQINWVKGRPTAAQYIESADWGGAVPPS